MLELTMNKWGYLEVDSGEWIEDRTAGYHEDAQRAMDHAIANGLDVIDWLNKIGATGLYGEGECFIANTVNEDNFLSRDLGIILAHTEKWDDLLIVANADHYGYGTWTAYTFNGDDDADAYDYGSGGASCDCDVGWKKGGCDSEWIIESGCVLWQNGGGQTEDISDLIHHDDDNDITYAVCPRCGYGNLTFWAN